MTSTLETIKTKKDFFPKIIPILIFALPIAISTNLYFAHGIIIFLFLTGFYQLLTKQKSPEKEKLLKYPKDFLLFIAIYAYKMLSGFVAEAKDFFTRWLDIVNKLPYFFLSFVKFNKNKIILSLHILLAFNASVSLIALIAKLSNIGFLEHVMFIKDDRFTGLFYNPLHFAGFLAILIVMCWAISLFYDTKFLVYVPFLFVGLVLTESRTYIVSIVICLLLISFIKSFRMVIIALFSILVVMMIFLLVSPQSQSRFFSVFDLSDNKIRLVYWEKGIELFRESPLLGQGYGIISEKLAPLRDAGIVDNVEHLHNIYIQEFAEIGIIGGLLTIGTLVYFVLKYYDIFSKQKSSFSKAFSLGISFCFLNILISGIFEYNFETAIVFMPLSYFMGIFSSYSKFKKAEKSL